MARFFINRPIFAFSPEPDVCAMGWKDLLRPQMPPPSENRVRCGVPWRTLEPRGTSWVSHTLPPMTLPAPIMSYNFV